MKTSGYPKGSPHDKPKPAPKPKPKPGGYPKPKPKPGGYPKGSPHEGIAAPLVKAMSKQSKSVKVVPNKVNTRQQKLKEEAKAKKSLALERYSDKKKKKGL
jgi:hypothetical protein